MEEARSIRNECTRGSCTCGVINPSEVFSIGSSRVFKRKMCDQNIRQTSGTEETILGETLLLFDLEEIKDLKDDDRNDAVAGELSPTL